MAHLIPRLLAAFSVAVQLAGSIDCCEMCIRDRASATCGVAMSPSATRVEASAAATPAFCRPMKVMNRPMPVVTVSYTHLDVYKRQSYVW